MQHQAERRIASQMLAQIVGSVDTDAQDAVESRMKSKVGLKRRKGFRKSPDRPLGEVIKIKQARRLRQAGRRKRRL